MPHFVCLDCGEKWLSCCPKCGSEQILFERKKPTSSFYDWIENEKKIINLKELGDSNWKDLWREYILYLEGETK